MKNKIFALGILAILLIGSALTYKYLGKANTHSNQFVDEHLTLNKHQKVHLVHAANQPEKGLLIYVADQSNSKKAIDYAKRFASLSYYVAIIDNESLLNASPDSGEQCVSIAKNLTGLSKQLQKRFNIDDDELPILVGTESSSSTVYAALAQAEKLSFHAAVSINFKNELKLHSPLCEQKSFAAAENQQLKLIAVKRLPTSFYIFQDENASPDSIKFTDKIGNVKLTISGDKKQNAQSEAIQILQWLDPRLADQISSDASDSDLPLIEVPIDEQKKVGTQDQPESMAIILTGDGGWAEIDKNIAKILADKGIPTVALDSLSYFWKARTSEETAHDVQSVIEQYLEKWNKKNVILIGYSFGADVLPFVANNLSPETQQKVSLIALLGMGKTAAFEFRLSSWMNADTNPNRLPLLPEIAKMKWANSICVYGLDDKAANCLPTAELGVNIISMTGDHHFDEKYDELVQHIIDSEKPTK